MLRLTLRTLLAYLDDTLEPAQAKDIGKKVGESEIAQETIDRIKTVTRRRRLSAPSLLADDHSTDPNTIAEYLDNVLPSDEVAELEQSALDNDVRLAEIAACHQILTLVLGEPAKVPPPARRRMYRLVSGPESIPYRQPAAAGAPVAGLAVPAEVDAFQDHDDDLLGTFLGPRKVLWFVCLLLAVCLLVVAVVLAIPPAPVQPTQGYVTSVAQLEAAAPPATAKPKLPDVVLGKLPDVPSPPPDTPSKPETGPMPRTVGHGPPAIREPDSERKALGSFDSPTQPLLFERRQTSKWERVAGNDGRVNSTDDLLALPGFHPEIRLDTGVRLQLWGNVGEILHLPLAESRVTLYVPAQGIDADLRLHGGRLFVTAPKAMRPVVVRLRFREETWDVTLATPDTEVAVNLIGEPAKGSLFDRDILESPRAIVYLGVLQGVASMRNGFQQTGDLRPARIGSGIVKAAARDRRRGTTRTQPASPTVGRRECPRHPPARIWQPPSPKWHGVSGRRTAPSTSTSMPHSRTRAKRLAVACFRPGCSARWIVCPISSMRSKLTMRLCVTRQLALSSTGLLRARSAERNTRTRWR